MKNYVPMPSRLTPIIAVIAMLIATNARAGEFYGLQLDGKCRVEIGAITRVHEKQISLLTIDGRHLQIPANDVKTVFIFNSVANPVLRVESAPLVINELKSVYATPGTQPSFVGWPVRFIENLVVFLDLEGKSHVLDLETIYQIRAVEVSDLPPFPITPSGVSYGFDLSSFLPECGPLGDGHSERLNPTRTLAEQIRVRQLLDDLEKGYEKLENLQERTRFYAKPFLFDRRARLGFTNISNHQEGNSNIPVYIAVSTGRPFRFQGYSVIGAQTHDHLPSLEPALLFRSDVKAHFFHVHLSGNMLAFSAGRKFYTGSTFFGGDSPHGPAQAEAQMSFNYMALMGFDYGPLSLSGGRYYPIFAIRNLKDSRELLSQDSAPIFDFSYTRDKYRVTLVYALDINRNPATPSSADFIGSTGSSTAVPGGTPYTDFTPPCQLHLNAGFWRLNGEFQLLEPTRLSASFFSSYLRYREVSSPGTNLFNTTRKGLALSMRQDFGDYVAVALAWNHSWNNLDLNYFNAPFATSYSYSQYGGSFEFLF